MADSDTKTLKQRIAWEFEYTDLDIMLLACICQTCGVRKPKDTEGGYLSFSDKCVCICFKCASDCAVNLHYTCLRANVSQTFLDVKYDQGKRGESPGQCTPTILCMEAGGSAQVCFCINCSNASACGKPDGLFERACHCLCLSMVCQIPPGTSPHNNPLVCGLCTKYFIGG